MYGRYECTTEGHNKFWIVIPDGDDGVSAIAIWGPIGSQGRITFMDLDKVGKKVAEKLGKGYVMTSNPGEALIYPGEDDSGSVRERVPEIFHEDAKVIRAEAEKEFKERIEVRKARKSVKKDTQELYEELGGDFDFTKELRKI